MFAVFIFVRQIKDELELPQYSKEIRDRGHEAEEPVVLINQPIWPRIPAVLICARIHLIRIP